SELVIGENTRRFEAVVLQVQNLAAEFYGMPPMHPKQVVIELVGVVANQHDTATSGAGEASSAAHGRVAGYQKLRQVAGLAIHREIRLGKTVELAETIERHTLFIHHAVADGLGDARRKVLRPHVVEVIATRDGGGNNRVF